MTTIRYLEMPSDDVPWNAALLENWRTGQSMRPVGGQAVSFQQLIDTEDYTKIDAWLSILTDHQARRVWALYVSNFKKPTSRDPKEWREPFQLWHDAQMAMEGVERGESMAATSRDRRIALNDLRRYLSQDEIDSMFGSGTRTP